MQRNFFLVQYEELIADEFLFTLDLCIDLSIGYLYSVALNEAISTNRDDLFVTLHTIINVEQLHDWVVLAIVLLSQFDRAKQVA